MFVKNRPESRDFQLCLKVMLARAIFLVLVLFSTLGQAPLDGQQKKVTLTCQSQPKALPCKLKIVAPLTIAEPVRAETGPHSLTSRVSSHTHVSLLFLDPVSVISMTVGGVCMLLLLGAIAWAIIILVWIVCTAVVSRINPLTKKRVIIIKHYCISGRWL